MGARAVVFATRHLCQLPHRKSERFNGWWTFPQASLSYVRQWHLPDQIGPAGERVGSWDPKRTYAGQWIVAIVPDRVEPQSLIRCSEVEGIDRRWQSYCL